MALFKKKPEKVEPQHPNEKVQIGEEQTFIGREGKIGKEDILKAEQLLKEYKQGKANLEKRVVANEQWWKMRHWDLVKKFNPLDPTPASGWLFNSIANKHADAMDNYPEPNILPREESDEDIANVLSSIVPCILEENDFEQVYNDIWWYKLKAGTGIYGVFWDSGKENGIGDISIRKVDILNVFWEAGLTDIQKSPNLFTVELVDRDILKARYPFLTCSGMDIYDVNKYYYDDSIDTSKKASVVDWYYKSTQNGRSVLHYCKFCEGEIIYASENDPNYAERGFYDHGQYPFVFDTLFEVEGTPCGFGYVDVMKDAQLYIDKLNQAILKNAVESARPRYFISDASNVNEQEFMDVGRDVVHVAGSIDDTKIKQIQVNPMPSIVATILEMKIEEIKETSGNRDFSQGGTTSGVTAASAIAALMEAGSKLSRDMIKSGYRAFARVCELVVELIRQFYDDERCFRITGKQGEQKFVVFDNSLMQGGTENVFGMELAKRKPSFDIKISAQKNSPMNKVSQNEFAKELYQLRMFDPQMADQALLAIDLMDFDGKEELIQKISQNGTMYQQMMQMQAQMEQMAGMLGMQAAQQEQSAPTMGEARKPVETDSLGNEKPRETAAMQRRRAQAREATNV